MTPLSWLFTLMLFSGLAIGIPHPLYEAHYKICETVWSPTGYMHINSTITLAGECTAITCLPDLAVVGLTCPTYFVFPGCHLTETDLSNEYPDCCPQIFCTLVDYAEALDTYYNRTYNRTYNN